MTREEARRARVPQRCRTLEEIGDEYIAFVLDELAGGDKSKAARMLGISRETLRRRLKRYREVDRPG